MLPDRTDQGLTPRFVKGEPPTDTDIAAVVQKLSRRVIRKLRLQVSQVAQLMDKEGKAVRARRCHRGTFPLGCGGTASGFPWGATTSRGGARVLCSASSAIAPGARLSQLAYLQAQVAVQRFDADPGRGAPGVRSRRHRGKNVV